MTGTGPAAQEIDTTRPHPARVYDWFLGGRDNYPVDEELGRRIAAIDGGAPRAALANRAFMRRATRRRPRGACASGPGPAGGVDPAACGAGSRSPAGTGGAPVPARATA